MKLELKLLLSFTVILLLSSCGVITKARYGNGLKLNIESNLFARKDKSEAPKTSAKKKKIVPQITDAPLADAPTISIDSNVLTSSIQSSASTEITNTNSALIDKKKFQKKVPTKSKGISKVLKPIKKQAKDKLNKKIEPNIVIAAWLFFGSIAANAYIMYFLLNISPYIFAAIGLAYLLSVIFAFVGLNQLNRSDNTYSGRKLALSIIVLFFLSIIYFLLALAILAIFL